MMTMLPSLCLISSKQTVSSNQCLCCSTGLKLSWPNTKLQNVGAGDPSLTILIDHGSYAVLPTIDRPQLGWLTRGVDPSGWEVLTPWKYVGRVRVCFDPLKMLHSFIQNCCYITASFAASKMNSWTLSLHLHWSCLWWRCYHPYIWSAPSRQCPPINAFAAIYWITILAKDKIPKRGCRWAAINNPHRWCTSWRGRGVHLPWQ